MTDLKIPLFTEHITDIFLVMKTSVSHFVCDFKNIHRVVTGASGNDTLQQTLVNNIWIFRLLSFTSEVL